MFLPVFFRWKLLYVAIASDFLKKKSKNEEYKIFPAYSMVISIHFNLPKTKSNPLKNVKGHYVLKATIKQ